MINILDKIRKLRLERNWSEYQLAEKSELNSLSLIADDFVWPGEVEPPEAFEASAKIRLRSKTAFGKVEKYVPAEDDKTEYKGQAWRVTFDEEQYAITPGQSLVLYKDNVIIGSGTIVRSI